MHIKFRQTPIFNPMVGSGTPFAPPKPNDTPLKFSCPPRLTKQIKPNPRNLFCHQSRPLFSLFVAFRAHKAQIAVQGEVLASI